MTVQDVLTDKLELFKRMLSYHESQLEKLEKMTTNRNQYTIGWHEAKIDLYNSIIRDMEIIKKWVK